MTHFAEESSTKNRSMHTIDPDTVWKNVLLFLEKEITSANFKTWFRDTFIHTIDDGTIILGVPSVFVKDFIRDKFKNLILRKIREELPDIRNLEFTIVQRFAPQKTITTKSSQTHELPLNDYYIDKNDNLNPKYQFETFVVGPFNQLAHTAAKTVVTRPGITYNPLFIYGHTGHGKTHLIQAVGNKLKKMGKKVLYATSERFAVDYITSVQSGTANNFKDKYRQYDVLIMDDVQFLSKTDKTQEELFHLFNAYYDTNRQIVFSSDVHPSLLNSMEERLRSRFNQGMIVDIPRPDFESRMAIISSKASSLKVFLDASIIEYLASTLDGNIRELEGVINSLSCRAEVLGRPMKLEEVEIFIVENLKPNKSISIKEVIARIAKFYNLTPSNLFEKTRRQDIVRPRQLTMYILREDFEISYPVIGQEFGGRDHTTVIHSCEKIKKDAKNDSNLEKELDQLRALFK